MKSRLLAAGLVIALPALALAQDKSCLSDRGTDDVDFAKALVANGYPDLAERLLGAVEKFGKGADQAKAQIAAIKLDVAQDNAQKITDPIERKNALVKVLGDKEKFIEEFKGKDAAEEVRSLLPELYNLIGESIAAALKKEKDEKALDALRSEGDKLFQKAEEALKERIAALKGIADRSEADENKLQAARYNYPHLMYYHSLIYPAGSSQRTTLCKAAIAEFDEFLLDYEGGDNPVFYVYYVYIDYGLCLKETGAPDEAIKMFDKTIALRESWGPKTDKGKWPIPPGFRDIVDLVCYGLVQKVVVLRDQKKFDEVVKVGKEYFDSIDKPFSANQSMILAKELGDAQIAIGDGKGATDTAKKMIAEDPNGIGGQWGRELIEKIGGDTGESYTDALKTAEQKIAANDYDRGIAVCRRLLFTTANTPDESEAGSSCWLLIGFAYQKRGWFEEAALAYEAGLDRFPKAKGAAECLSRAIDMYSAANGRGRRQVLKERVEALKKRLIAEYPTAPQAADVQMKTAKQLEDEGDYLGAIEIYKKVEKTSTNYTKAHLLIGIDRFNILVGDLNEAKKLEDDAKKLEEAKKADDAKKKTDDAKKKRDESKGAFTDAEAAFKDAISVIQGHAQTMDPTILKAYDEQEYLAMLSLAKLYMMEGFGRASDAVPVIDTLEGKWGKDAKKGPEIQNLRGRVFLSQGKVDEAAKWVDDLVKRDPIGAAGPAGQLARVLDASGMEKFKTQPDSLEGDKLWTQAARYYWISIEPQVLGKVPQNVDEMTDLGNRFFVYGLHFNGVPEPKTSDQRTTFVDWTPGPKRNTEMWTRAAQIYEAALAQNWSYRMAISLGRTYGFLAKYADAASTYSKLFDQEQIVDQKLRSRLDRTVIAGKPELVMAYIEWGTAERLAAQGTDKDRLTRAMTIMTLTHNTQLKLDQLPHEFWAAHYQLVRTLIDRGEYKDAQASIDDLTRNVSADFDGGKFGYKQRFLDTVEELKKK
jgi:hypothetical protein